MVKCFTAFGLFCSISSRLKQVYWSLSDTAHLFYAEGGQILYFTHTSETHQGPLSGLLTEPLFVMKVDEHKVYGLQPKGLSCDNDFLPGIKDVVGLFATC